MRQETLWQGERRAARMHWWRQVLDRPVPGEGEELFDEVLSLRFRPGLDKESTSGREGTQASWNCWA